MGRKIKKKDVEQNLLGTLFKTEEEWKQLNAIISQSIDPSMESRYTQAVARAKFLYLLHEARHRNLSAIKYTKHG